MKFNSLIFLLLSVVSFANAGNFLPLAHTTVNPPRWEKLGERAVNFGLDRDEIFVTAREGRFTALQLRIEGAPINLHRCVVHFANGGTQELNIRENIGAGRSTRVLNLAGNRLVITKVVFWYDTDNDANRRGRIALWGRH